MMRKGKIAARILTAAIALSMLGQNVATVYAEEPAIVLDDSAKKDESNVDANKEVEPQQNDSEKKDDAEQDESKKTEEETPKPEDDSKKDGDETPKPEDDTKKDENKDEESDASKDEDKKENESEKKDDAEKDGEESEDEVTLSETAKAFLDAWKACKDLIPEEGITSIMNDAEAYGAFAKALEPVDEAYDALTEDDLAQDDVEAAVAEYEALFEGSDEPVTLDGGVASVNGQEYETLQKAIDAAGEGDTVTLNANTTENIKITKAITLDLNKHTLTGNGSKTVVSISAKYDTQITVKNGKITGGNYKYNGGGINISNATVKLSGLEICDNHAANGAGVSIVQNANVTIEGCNLHDNIASNAGGAVHLNMSGKNGVVCTIRNTTIQNNRASGCGGALQSGASTYLSYGTTAKFVVEEGTVIKSNTSSRMGGAVHLQGNAARFEMNGGEISRNTASLDGGAIYAANWCGVTINGGKISENTSNGNGGAVYISGNGYGDYNKTEDAILKIGANAEITENNAIYGGGVYAIATTTQDHGVTVAMENGAQLYNNTASMCGDDIYSRCNWKNYSGQTLTANAITLVATDAMGGDLILDDDNQKITDWYYDGYKNGETTNRYSEKGYYEIYTPVSGDSTHVALKAAHYETKTLDADMLIDDNDTEHTAVPNVIIGSSHSIIGQINVKTINDQINAIGAQYDEKIYDQITLSDVDFQFTAVLEAPEGVTLPSDLSKATVNIAGFEVDTNKSSISGQTATVVFKASEANTKTYGTLKKLVNEAAEDDAWLSITIPDVKIDKDAALEQKTFVGTVEGEFSATASLGPVSKKFAFGWETKQSDAGRDYTVSEEAGQEAKDKIQLTVNVVALGVAYDANGGTDAPTDDGKYAVGDTVTVMRAATRSGYRFTGWLYNGTTYQPGDTFTMPNENVTLVAQWSRIPDDDDDDDDDDEPTPVPAHTDDHPLPQQVQTISEAGAVEAPVQEIVETGEVTEQPAVIEESGHISATGDDSLMNVYGAAAAAAAGILALWFVKRRRHA